MVLRLALLMLALNSGLAEASNRSTRIAMAVALLDVAEEHCGSSIEVDPEMRKTLFLHFHEYDIAGLASVISRELNAFYEDFIDRHRRFGGDARGRTMPVAVQHHIADHQDMGLIEGGYV